jgi:hypothetical protein
MSNPAPQTLLRNLSNDKTQAFDPDHAQRILDYPGGGWGPVAEAEVSGDGAGEKLPAADDAEKTGGPVAFAELTGGAKPAKPARASRTAPATNPE